MPVETPHPTYTAAAKKWKKYACIVDGEDAVKECGTEFLPMLGGQTNIVDKLSNGGSYRAYKERALFFAATARTVDGIEGVVFRKDPIVVFPEARKDFLDNVGKEGESLPTFAKNVFNSLIVKGRHGCLLDIQGNASATDAPYFVSYSAESIINWRTEIIDGEDKITLIVLQENVLLPDADDMFSLVEKKKIRVLSLAALKEGGDRVYSVDIWEKQEKNSSANKDAYIKTGTITPTIRGNKLNYIPFVFFGPKELTARIQKSPIADLVSINISHYRSSADLEHGRHFTALPTAWVAGFPVDTVLEIGSTTAWVSETPEANASYLEFTGQGLGALENALKEKAAYMAIMGARLLEEPKKSVESADTHMIRKGGEEGVTAALSRTVSAGFTLLLKWSAEWMGLNAEVSCELNRDYTSMEMSPQMLMALMSALQSGNLSRDTWIYNLKRGELLPEGRTLEQELDLIEEHPPVPPKEVLDLGEEVPPIEA